MALCHLSVKQIKRSAGQSAVAAAAYRAGEKLHSDYYGEDADYTKKGGVVFTKILLPRHAPPEYADRETFWNTVEQVEEHPKAQLAYSFDIALQNEFTVDENIELARRFITEQFVSRGKIADLAVHTPDKGGENPNPHFHVLCPIRPLNEDGTWGKKQKRVYELDEHGNRIPDRKGDYVFKAVPTTDWGRTETLEAWRRVWAALCNAKLEEKGLLFCSDCGEKLYYGATNNYRPECAFFDCSLHWKHQDKCPTHYIRESVLERMVLKHMQLVTGYILRYEDHFRSVMESQLRVESAEKLKISKGRLERNEKRIAVLKRLFIKIYEDNARGKRRQHIHIKYDGLGFIPLNELLKEETA